MKAARNDLCPCGSGRKYKRCCSVAPTAAPAATRNAAIFPPLLVPTSPLMPAGPITEAGELATLAIEFARSLRIKPTNPAAAPPGEPGSTGGNTTQGQPTRVGSATARSAQEKFDRGNRLLLGGKVAAAITTLQAGLRLDPDNPVAHYDLGVAFLESQQLPEAIASFWRAIALKPDFQRALHNLGTAYNRQGDAWRAIAAYRQAVALAPGEASAHSRLGDLLFNVGEYQAGIEHYQRAAAIEPRTRLGRISRARAFVMQERYAEAEGVLRRSIALDPTDGAAHLELGHLLITLGRFEEAVARLEQALAIDPSLVDAYNVLTSAKRITEEDHPLITQMLLLLEQPSATDPERIILHYALGKAHNDLKDYAEVMRHFDAAHRLQHRYSRFDRGRWEKNVGGHIARFTSEFLASHASLGVKDEMPLLILGMPRSGTTLVEQIISSHPAVAAGGELRFWGERGRSWEDAGAEGLTPSYTRRLVEDYRATLRKISPTAARVTDKNPFNFIWIGLIHLVFPQARIIHCRRSPIDTCLSIYTTHFAEEKDYVHNRNDLVFYYRQYERLMAHWRALLPANRFFEVDYEELIVDRERLTRELVAFCGLVWDEACLRPEDNRRAVSTASLWQARQPVYRTSVERWRYYEPWLGELRDLLPRAGTTCPRNTSGLGPP